MVPGSVAFQCPECVTAGLKRTRQRDLPYGGKRRANPALTSIVLIAINAIVFAAVNIMGGLQGRLFELLAIRTEGACISGDRYYLIAKAECLNVGYHWADGVATGAWWQVITSAFTHLDVMHIGFNMLALWFLGPGLERVFGRARFLAIYLTAALMGSALVMWFSEPYTATVGASGAIFGLMAAILLAAHKHKGDVRTILMWLGANVLITIFGSAFISWQGHLGGFIGGALATAAVMYIPKDKRKQLQWPAVAAVAVLALVLVVLGALRLAS